MIQLKSVMCSLGLVALVVMFQAPISALSSESDTIQGLEISATERLRFVTWDNAVTLADTASGDNTFMRHRTSVSARWQASSQLEAVVKLTNEFRYYFKPDDRDFNVDEIIFDLLYLKYRINRILPGTLTLGRQDIRLGEGFIVFESNPLDGSRATSFNAIRYDLDLGKKRLLTMFASYQPEHDNWLPVLNDQDQRLIERPEFGAGAYFQGQFTGNEWHAYVVYKNRMKAEPYHNTSRTACLGTRIVTELTPAFNITAETAIQIGNHDQYLRRAYAEYFHADFKTSWPIGLPQKIRLGALHLSGENHENINVEVWDPMFARWPQWSESYIYTLIQEGGVAYWSNLGSYNGRVTFVLPSFGALDISYFHLLAPTPNHAWPDVSGRTRGNLLATKLSFQASPNISGHVLWETFRPRTYYSKGADGYHWVRVELLLSI